MNHKSQDELERTCCLNGKRPNLRDRWKAFYRLWRLATRDHDFAYSGRDDAFRILHPGWYLLVVSEDRLGNRKMWPMFLRRRVVERERQRRKDRQLLAAIMRPVKGE